MELDLEKLSERFLKLRTDMFQLHSSYSGEMLDDHVMGALADEIIIYLNNCELESEEKNKLIKKALTNVFFIGEIIKE